ncbi:MAG: hypothetical protein NC252_02145 [Roseburia sp.]|nr:hypothetical protein [Roseburia sp.]MCM1420074.1 hypothetical protein [Bacteroides sp.]
MIKEEDKILRRIGKESPFTVPEGYFDNLTERIMDVLPKAENTLVADCRKKTRNASRQWIGWFSIAAACVACVVFFNIRSIEPERTAAVSDVYTDEYVEYDDEYQQDVMQYVMLGHEDVYCYLSGVEL